MEDSSETLEQLQQRRVDEKYARMLLFDMDLNLDEDSMFWISNHIDCFGSASRGNESIETVFLYPHAFNVHDDEVWDKLGQAIGNLQALDKLYICTPLYHDNDDDDDPVVFIIDSDIVARILSHVRRKIEVYFGECDDSVMWTVEQVQALARAIRGHPTITRVDSGKDFPHEASDVLHSALATLPALESIALSNYGQQAWPERESTHESLTVLFRVPTLRSVRFSNFSFTPALCQATANAFVEGTAVTKLEFSGCSFSALECAAIMANGFSINTSMSEIRVVMPLAQELYSALATALPLNSTLRHLDLGRHYRYTGGDPDLSPVFEALGKNTGLKTLIVGRLKSMDESLCTAMQNGLGMNETLESLELNNVRLCDDIAALWFRALSFLRTNKALKSLEVGVESGVTEACFYAFRIDIVAMLQENTSLESLSIIHWGFKIKAEEYFVHVTALQDNTTLKSLNLTNAGITSLTLTHDEDKRMAALLKKNYGLESLLKIDLENEAGHVGTILRLNAAGRRYLIEDGSSVTKGVKVLSAVSNEINCVFLHLLENPTLCDRNAVEAASDSADNGGSTSPTAISVGGKREPASVRGGKESRRRLA